ncbi:Mitotic spindle assembly checkpoint protein MAD1 [Dictyocoela roeselum]|nr:Mitotic spindle assembly checkpoint protein MAD1 [Dictyocoela roeselum]
MDSVYQKMNDLIKENADLKKRIIDIESKSGVRELEVENSYLKGRVQFLETEILKLKSSSQSSSHCLSEDKENVNNSVFADSLNSFNAKQDPHSDNGHLTRRIAALEAQLAESDKAAEDFRFALKEIRHHVLGLLGYKIEFIDNKVVLLSAYAFDRDDVFVFQRNGDQMELINNDFAAQWMKEIDTYMVKSGSIPAFLASVTMELYNQKTFN